MKKYIAILAALAFALPPLPPLPANADTYTGNPVVVHSVPKGGLSVGTACVVSGNPCALRLGLPGSPVTTATYLMLTNEFNDITATLDRGFISREIGNHDHSAHFAGQRARGTVASPTVILANDFISGFTAEAYTGSAYQRAGYNAFIATSVAGATITTNERFAVDVAGTETPVMDLTPNGLKPLISTYTLGSLSSPFLQGYFSPVPIDASIASVVGSPALYGGTAAGSDSTTGFVAYGNDASGATFATFKTRAATTAPTTILADGDSLLQFAARGSDGAAWAVGSRLRSVVDGTPGSGVMPARWEFLTSPAGSGTPLVRMIITAAGMVVLGATKAATVPALKASGTTLQVRLGDDSAFAPIAASAYSAGATAGVTCAAGISATTGRSVNGIITAC